MTAIVVVALLARLSWYDPALCADKPINCFDPDHWWRMAAGHDARDWYDRALACPQTFKIGTRFTISGSRGRLADGEWLCLDRGGAVVVNDDGSIVLDLLTRSPIWSETLIVKAEIETQRPQALDVALCDRKR